MAHGYLTYECSYPKDTPTMHPNSLPDGCSVTDDTRNDRKVISFDDETGWAQYVVKPLSAFFGRRLDKVDGLSLELSYTGYEDDFGCYLRVKDNEFLYLEAETTFEPLPMSMCEIDISCDGDEDDDAYAEPLLDGVHRWITNLSESYAPPVRALALTYALHNGGVDVVINSLSDTERAELAAMDDNTQAFFVASAIMEQSKQIIDSALAHGLQGMRARWDADECKRRLAEFAH